MKSWTLARRRKVLQERARLIQAMRNFFIEEGYFEVETPYRIPAPAPESHIDALASGKWFLHTSPELCMKRMLAAGYEKIFQICRCWREGERGSQHIPEFTLLEWYCSVSDYKALMEECEALIQHLAGAVGMGQKISFRGREIDLMAPWERITVSEAFRCYTKTCVAKALEDNLFDEIMIDEIEPRLGINKPTFIYDYPAERAALARLKQEDQTIAERFELYISGLELANAFSELIKPEEQRRRFEIENSNRRSLGKPAYPIPEKFLAEMNGMAPSAGIALGVDRLIMVFLDVETIDDVVAFTPEEL